MNISESTDNGVIVVHVKSGRIDAASANALCAALSDIAARGVKQYVVDLSAVQFIDSTGLGALVAARKQLGRDGCIGVLGACESVTTLFRVTRMDKVFPLHHSRAEAVATLAGLVQ